MIENERFAKLLFEEIFLFLFDSYSKLTWLCPIAFHHYLVKFMLSTKTFNCHDSLEFCSISVCWMCCLGWFFVSL